MTSKKLRTLAATVLVASSVVGLRSAVEPKLPNVSLDLVRLLSAVVAAPLQAPASLLQSSPRGRIIVRGTGDLDALVAR